MFNLPVINRELTKKAVEDLLEQYKVFLMQTPEDHIPKVTASYSIIPPSNTNEFKSSTEDLAIKKVDSEVKREKFLSRIQRAVNRLPQRERAIIVLRYMQLDHKYDYEVFNELGLSERSYYRLKGRVFYNLAFILRVEVYKEENR